MTTFLHSMTESPVNVIDFYQPDKKKLDDMMKFKGKDHMVFMAPRCDADIQKKMNEENRILDVSPAQPPNIAWKMRPR